MKQSLKEFQTIVVTDLTAQQYVEFVADIEDEFAHYSKEMLKEDKGRYNKNRSIIAQGKHVQKFIEQGLQASTPMSVIIAMTHTQQFIV